MMWYKYQFSKCLLVNYKYIGDFRMKLNLGGVVLAEIKNNRSKTGFFNLIAEYKNEIDITFQTSLERCLKKTSLGI